MRDPERKLLLEFLENKAPERNFFKKSDQDGGAQDTIPGDVVQTGMRQPKAQQHPEEIQQRKRETEEDASFPAVVELQIRDGINMINVAQVEKHRDDPEQQSSRDIGERIGQCRRT